MQISNILIKVISFALKAAIKQGIIHVGVGLVLFLKLCYLDLMVVKCPENKAAEKECSW